MQHPHFLPSNLTVGEAKDLGPRYTTVEDLAPVRDASVEQVSQNRRVHMPVKELDTPIWVVEPETEEPVNSSEAEFDQGEEMVTN